MSERIQKFLSGLGYGSRREVEEWINDGRLVVNGEPATVGQKISEADAVKLDGKRLSLKAGNEPLRVLLYKKRTGEMVTRDDPEGRRTVFRKLPELETGRWIAVGRLDVNTSGLLLMTNHGELARRLMHPSFEQRREYAVRALGEVTDDTFATLRKGVMLEDGEASFESIRFGDNEIDDDEGDGEGGNPKANRWFVVTISEGRHREVRRLFESQGLTVNRLIRTAYGPIKLGGGIKSGSYREATAEELKKLIDAVNLDPKEMLPERVRESHRTKSDYSAHKRPGLLTAEAEPAPVAPKRGDSKTAHRAAAALAKSQRRDAGSTWVKASRDERKEVERAERRQERRGAGSEEPTYVVKPPRAGGDSPWGKGRIVAVESVAADDDAPQQFKARGFGAASTRSYQERGDKAPASPQRRYQSDSRGESRSEAPRRSRDERPARFEGERKPYGERPRPFGDKPSFGKAIRKTYGERPAREDGERPRFARPDKPSVSKPYVKKGERPTDTRSGDKPRFNTASSGERKPYGERPRFGAGADRKPYGAKPAPRPGKPTQRFVVKDGAATRPGKPQISLRKKRDDRDD